MGTSEFKARWKAGFQATLLREPKRNAIITGVMVFLAVVLLLAGSISPLVAALIIFLNPVFDLVRATVNSYRVAKNPESARNYQTWLERETKKRQERQTSAAVALNWYGWYRQTWPENQL